ncbi:MAG TPA: bifunctional ADP-heptose synthase [Saprospiraceae bacterium]|nr:carbohydrate kinase [Saprospiraceae bacterium]MCC6689533.1 hypothetical protein [Saprospiraceae bacterium]HMX82438.1 bifunctional ADP-heptose synthase [Saprospiraceae bacterium]HMX84906.1 bifunctional ADP-heptose synthase [Saprospiraceae bacterium]HMZ72100.1 bifunctional ADP-heptose synthase [Saprospiraceae bacterium]
MSFYKNVLGEFRNKKVLIAGDIMTDRYLTGTVNRISPEAPVPVVQLTHADDRLGGAGNVALNVKAYGAIPILLTVVGEDDDGLKLLKQLNSLGIEHKFICKSVERRTTVKTRIVSQNQQMMRIDAEDTFELTHHEKQVVIAQYVNALKETKPDVIILQDYNKGFFTPELIQVITRYAADNNIPVTVDPKKANFLDFKGVTIFKPNLKEVKEALNTEIKPEIGDLKNASGHIRDILGNKITVITLSENGLFIDDGVDAKIYPTTPRNISDVCGAGDTVISTLSLGIASGLSAYELAVMANVAGGQVCERPGVVPVDPDQLILELSETLYSEKT